MKQIGSQAINQQRLSRIGGDTGIKERILSRILTVCCTKGMSPRIGTRNYKGGDYEKKEHLEQYAARCYFWKDGNLKLNQFNQ